MIQIAEQNDEQKKQMYAKLTKDELITMLIQANKVIDVLSIKPQFEPYVPCQPFNPYQPYPIYSTVTPDWTARPEFMPFYNTCSNA